MNWKKWPWKSKGLVDVWSAVHLLWGIILSLNFSYFGMTLAQAFAISIVLMFLWELFERAIGVGENLLNVIGDMLVGVTGFVIGYFVILPTEAKSLFFLVTLLIALILQYMGWRAFLSR